MTRHHHEEIAVLLAVLPFLTPAIVRVITAAKTRPATKEEPRP